MSDPTCQGQPITSATSYCLGGLKWSTPNALCMSGTLPIVDSLNPDYTNNWGLLLGVDATLNMNARLGNFSQTLGQPFRSITVTLTGAPQTGTRVQVHRSGDSNTVAYCAYLTSGVAIPLTSFNTKCYDVPVDGVALTAADIPNIDQVGVIVPSTTTGAVSVTNLCITSIAFSMTAPACAAPSTTGTCNTAGNVYCGGTVCCSPSYPYYCPVSNKCYSTEAGALGACGGPSCTACAPSAG